MVGCTFELLFFSLGIDAGMRAALLAARPAHRRRRWAKRLRTAPCRPSRLLRSWCNAGAIVAQDRCPAFSMAEGGEVRLLVGSGASSERISAAGEAADGPNGRLPVRDGHPRYVRRGQL